MTDTPRTQDELLTIFEDGQTSGISAQDMRDYVVSTMSSPGIQDCFYSAIRGGNLPISLADNIFTSPPLAHTPTDVTEGWFYDPNGWLQGTAQAEEDAWGTAADAYAWLSLPAGIYVFNAYAAFPSTQNTGYASAVAADTNDKRADTEGLDPWAWFPAYAVYMTAPGVTQMFTTLPDLGFGYKTLQTMTVLRVLESVAPVAVNAISVRQKTGGVLDLLGVNVIGHRIGNGG